MSVFQPPTRRDASRRRARQQVTKVLRRTALVFVSILLVVGGGAAGYGAYVAAQFDASVNVIAEPFAALTTRPEPTNFGALNLLLLGTDTRGSLGTNLNVTGSRSDTILFVNISSDRKSVQVVSIPRDSWVPIEGYGTGKINWALSYGGVKLAVTTIENLLDAQIDHVAIIDFTGVKRVTTVIGGVPVDNPVAFDVLMDPAKLTKLFQSIGKSMLVDKGFNSGLVLTLGAQLRASRAIR